MAAGQLWYSNVLLTGACARQVQCRWGCVAHVIRPSLQQSLCVSVQCSNGALATWLVANKSKNQFLVFR
jgi:hypothetical protein